MACIVHPVCQTCSQTNAHRCPSAQSATGRMRPAPHLPRPLSPAQYSVLQLVLASPFSAYRRSSGRSTLVAQRVCVLLQVLHPSALVTLQALINCRSPDLSFSSACSPSPRSSPLAVIAPHALLSGSSCITTRLNLSRCVLNEALLCWTHFSRPRIMFILPPVADTTD